MVELYSLWLPVLLSSVFVFIVSSLIHTVLPWHKKDYPKLPMEDKTMDALRPLNLPPGEYMVPRASNTAEMRTPEFTEKLKRGPVLILTVLKNGPPSMTANLVGWFLYSVVISFFTAYVLARTVPAGAAVFHVFRIAGVVSFLGYAAALWEMSIWYRRKWSMTIKATVDGIIYALITALTFGWLWMG
jgi:hypothetical protein